MDANANVNANANADAGGSTIALRELCSGELIKPEITDIKTADWMLFINILREININCVIKRLLTVF